ncbi:MAG: MFS transporter, partial [Simkania negevensis]|nr:MFS transporter [Simkania negevensis]
MIQTQKGVSLFISAIALSLCVFMQVLDLSIANVAIPYIAGDLAISDFNGTWVITMFTVGNAIVLPLTGWLTKRFGSVRVMIASTALFTLFSFFCGISISIEMLMAMRFIQGIVGGPLIPLSMSLMLMIFPPNKKMLAIAIWNMVGVVGPIMGPILGGWLTFDYSWPWIFFVNVPVGIVVVILVCFMLKGQETEITKTPVDWTGIFLLS